jgi:3-hydroxybutyryl-CoA dehydrogenase
MIRQISILGTGTMGRGIAYLSAVAGYDTVMFDADAGALDAARAAVESILRKGVEKGKLGEAAAAEAMARLQLVPELEPAVNSADLIVEAVPESLELKIELFAQADLFCGEHTILATNTSSISITQLASNVERRDRFVGMHFFNPPHLMKLVEIVRGERTSDDTVEQVRDVAEKMGKTPILVRDSPLRPRARRRQAQRSHAREGVASAEDIDRAMELATTIRWDRSSSPTRRARRARHCEYPVDPRCALSSRAALARHGPRRQARKEERRRFLPLVVD